MKTLQRLAMDYYLNVEVLYKRSSDGTLLRCFDGIKAKNAPRSSRRYLCNSCWWTYDDYENTEVKVFLNDHKNG